MSISAQSLVKPRFHTHHRRHRWSAAGLASLGLVLSLALATDADALKPCCTITSIDAETGLVTAKETASGRVFHFKLSEARDLATLKLGQPVWLNPENQLSLDGRTFNIKVIKIGPAGQLRGEPGDACGGVLICSAGLYCETPVGGCGGAGKCAVIPQQCPLFFAPVCGCDGKTYGNGCNAAAAGVSVARAGKCAQ